MNTKPYNTKEEKMYRVFTDELEAWSSTGAVPSMGNQDIHYYLDLQKERLEKRNLKMEYGMKLRGEHMDEIHHLIFKDRIYTNMLAFSGYLQKTCFYREGKKVYEQEKPTTFYQTITKMEQQRPEETYCCPSCGAISPIKVLLEGCPYCQTRFVMSDLFPKVTSYYFQYDVSMNEKESKVRTRKWILGGVVGALLLGVGSTVIKGQELSIIGLVLGSIIAGPIAGYLLMSICMLLQLFGFGAGQTGMLVRTSGTKRKLKKIMCPHDKSFSYELFQGRILSLLKIMIFSKNTENLAVYEGKEACDFANIVEAEYRGGIGLNKVKIEKGYCYLDLDVYMTVLYDKGKICRENEVFRMVVCRKLQKESDLGFSIKKVQCSGCGGSFDATRERHCIYCGKEYHLKEDDWVVVGLRMER